MLEKTKYRCREHHLSEYPAWNEVVYAIVDGCCYFSGTERHRHASTIDAANDIVAAIVAREEIVALTAQEEVAADSLRWFDLRTHWGYRKHRGEFELFELKLDPNTLRVVGWERAECPPEIRRLFSEYIDRP